MVNEDVIKKKFSIYEFKDGKVKFDGREIPIEILPVAHTMAGHRQEVVSGAIYRLNKDNDENLLQTGCLGRSMVGFLNNVDESDKLAGELQDLAEDSEFYNNPSEVLSKEVIDRSYETNFSERPYDWGSRIFRGKEGNSIRT